MEILAGLTYVKAVSSGIQGSPILTLHSGVVQTMVYSGLPQRYSFKISPGFFCGN